MTLHPDEQAREWLIEWNNKQALHPSQDKCAASLAALLARVRLAEAEWWNRCDKDDKEWKALAEQRLAGLRQAAGEGKP